MNNNRRKFIQKTGIIAASTVFAPKIVLSSNRLQKKKLGVALVGLGYYSTQLLAPAMELTKNCELRGIVTGSPDKIPVWQEKYQIKDSNIYNYENFDAIANTPILMSFMLCYLPQCMLNILSEQQKQVNMFGAKNQWLPRWRSVRL